jgi:hypothetical protein
MIVSTLDRVCDRSTWPPDNWLPPDGCSIRKCRYALYTGCYLSNITKKSLSSTRLEPGGSL